MPFPLHFLNFPCCASSALLLGLWVRRPPAEQHAVQAQHSPALLAGTQCTCTLRAHSARARCRPQLVTPLQKARVLALSYPHFPDLLQVCQAIQRMPPQQAQQAQQAGQERSLSPVKAAH